MSKQVTKYTTNDSLHRDFSKLLIKNSTDYLMYRRFDIGEFDLDDIFIMTRLSNVVCTDLCHFKCSVEDIREKFNYIIQRNK